MRNHRAKRFYIHKIEKCEMEQRERRKRKWQE